MAYRIYYGHAYGDSASESVRTGRTVLLSAFFCTLFLSAASRLWPEAQAVMDRLLSYDGFVSTKEALEIMALELQSGTSLSDAITDFCQEVISRSLTVAA